MTNFGKIITAIFLGSFSFLYSLSLSLKITDQKGNQLEYIDVVNPFIVEVTCDEEISQKPFISHLKELHVIEEKPFTQSVTFINGKKHSVCSWRYLVKAPKAGPLIIGPAFFNNNSVQSNTVYLRVHEKARKAAREFVLELICLKKQAFVGEKVPYLIRFSYPAGLKKSPQLNGIEPIRHPNIEVLATQKPKQHSYEKEGSYYNTYEWYGSFIPHKSGLLVIPPLKGYVEEATDIFSIFSRGKQQTILSEPLEIMVEELPSFHEKITAIGQFDTFTAHLEKDVMRQHQGVTLQLTLKGKGNLETISPPSLNMPPSFKWYVSSESIERKEKNDYKKYLYIIQPLQSGRWEIPPQQLTYFDPQERNYKTITTNTLWIEVTPSTLLEAPLSDIHFQPQEEQETSEVLKIVNVPYWRMQHIPWVYFFLMMFTPLCLFLLNFSFHALKASVLAWPRFKKYRLLSQARRKIMSPHKSWYALYMLFNELFVNVQHLSPSYELHQIIHYLSIEEQKEWQKYWEYIVRNSFSAHADTFHLYDYYREGKQWLNIFTTIIRKKL